MLDKLFAAVSRFAYGELTRHIREEKKAAADAVSRRLSEWERERLSTPADAARR